MTPIAWLPSMSVGIDSLDDDHKVLVAIIAALDPQPTAKPDRIGAVLDLLVRYVDVHFAREEKALAAAGFPHTKGHHAAHETMTEWIAGQVAAWRAGPGAFDIEKLRNALIDWLYVHILKEDMRYRDFVLDRRPDVDRVLKENPGLEIDRTIPN